MHVFLLFEQLSLKELTASPVKHKIAGPRLANKETSTNFAKQKERG